MTHTLKRTFAMLLLAIFGSTILYNCEPETDSLGEQLFNQDAAEGNEISYDIIAYNYNNNDSIRSDASRMITGLTESGQSISVGVLGAFTEGQFGMQKASYVTQLRMPVNNFDFNGPNPKVDSVVLVLRPPANTLSNTYFFEKDSLTTNNYEKSDFPVGTENVAVAIEKKTYPVRKYGKIGGAFKSMKINVHEVTTFLDTNNDAFTRSNANVSTGALLGSGVFDGKVNTVSITRKSDNSNVFTGNLGFRIKLSNTDFFQTQVLDKKGKPELQDASNFIRHIKGIKLSVEETDRYLFQFSPNDMELIMYYKYDKTDNGVVTHPQTSLKFNLGGANAHIGLYEYNRSGSAVEGALATSNPANGDAKLFVQSMGGPSAVLKIKDETIEALKAAYAKDKIAIVGAKIRLFVDPSSWVNKNSTEDRRFIIFNKDLANLSKFSLDTKAGLSLYYYGKTKDDKEYYDFVVTKTLKDIIEGKTEKDSNGQEVPVANRDFYINLGSFVGTSTGALLGVQNTTRAIDMNRVVLVGSESTNANRAQLKVTYATKK
ncbi:DUF4270 family protein [Chryseobacterium arthrosphaerae]|uniref:DUF4270 family protein n=1 Tax=Chryseobacterium arthrosphaerae TaxID=651561 RepID=UPI0023E29243|nr:DUF4270 family protein [Chryseobacterium arthrosphaerae]WES97359.1 DUF4270 family protein [Chryseobacterium arthrosphaerae]